MFLLSRYEFTSIHFPIFIKKYGNLTPPFFISTVDRSKCIWGVPLMRALRASRNAAAAQCNKVHVEASPSLSLSAVTPCQTSTPSERDIAWGC